MTKDLDTVPTLLNVKKVCPKEISSEHIAQANKDFIKASLSS